jgi:hypothetical protein
MITSANEFRDGVAFETYVLDKMLPVISGGENGSIDVRGRATVAAVQISITEDISASAVEGVKNDLTPLMFGAAWKVLDLAIELILNSGGFTADRSRGTEWSISAKQNYAANGDGQYQVLTNDRPVWKAVGALYANTVEHRHCLVHRTAVIDPSSGALRGTDRSGRVLLDLSLEQQKAVARIASLVAEAIIGGGIRPRNQDHLRHFLDLVSAHTNQPSFGVTRHGAPAEILTELECVDGQFFVDVQSASERAANVFQGVLHFNVVLDIPDETGRRLKANLEDIPPGRTHIDLEALPGWLSFV